VRNGQYLLPDKPGLGIELDDAACARHPYQKHAFPSLWDSRWVAELTKGERPIVAPAAGAPS